MLLGIGITSEHNMKNTALLGGELNYFQQSSLIYLEVEENQFWYIVTYSYVLLTKAWAIIKIIHKQNRQYLLHSF